MSEMLSDLDFCFTYLDDILIFSTSWEEHLQHLETVFNLLKTASLKVKLSKWQFFKRNLHYPGHLISEQGFQPLPDKIIAVKSLSGPKNIDEPHHFLAFSD